MANQQKPLSERVRSGEFDYEQGCGRYKTTGTFALHIATEIAALEQRLAAEQQLEQLRIQFYPHNGVRCPFVDDTWCHVMYRNGTLETAWSNTLSWKWGKGSVAVNDIVGFNRAD